MPIPLDFIVIKEQHTVIHLFFIKIKLLVVLCVIILSINVWMWFSLWIKYTSAVQISIINNSPQMTVTFEQAQTNILIPWVHGLASGSFAGLRILD